MEIGHNQKIFKYKITIGMSHTYLIPFKKFIDIEDDVSLENISFKHIKKYCDFLGDIFGFDIKFNEDIKSKC